jgi:hypothetical protein
MSTSGPTAAPPPAGTGSRHPLAARPPALFDPSIPHPARVYAFWLGGKDHYPADREAGREVVRLRPEILAGARANRAFGQRFTRYAATGPGIRQFLDIGAGLPAPGPTHQVAHGISPACRTVYADNDPLVTAHCRALLAAERDAAPCTCIDADVRDPAALLDSAREVLDFTQPVAVLLLAVLHFLPDTDDPAAILGQLAAALAPGSLIAVSHVTADYAPDAITDSAAAYNARVPLPVHPRSREQFAAILGDLPLRHPGIVPVSQWQPNLREPAPQNVDIYGAVAQIPPAAGPGAARPASVASKPAASDFPDATVVAAEVARRAAQFPEYEITCETTLGGVCFIAQGRSLGTHPYLVMASDHGRLFAALEAHGGPS